MGPTKLPRKLLETLKIYTEEETEARQEVMYENYISSMCCVTGQLIFDLRGSMVLSYGMRWDEGNWRCLLGTSWGINGMFGYVYWGCLLGDWTGVEPQYETGPVGINSLSDSGTFQKSNAAADQSRFQQLQIWKFPKMGVPLLMVFVFLPLPLVLCDNGRVEATSYAWNPHQTTINGWYLMSNPFKIDVGVPPF